MDKIALNKYLSTAGHCSRRKAADLIKKGRVTVDGNKVEQPFYRVSGNEKICVDSKRIIKKNKKTYVLFNKPKNTITTTDDEKGRRTVMEFVKNASPGVRLFPVGRLDRNTTGLLLLTNDGVLAQRLSHPKNIITKIYEITLTKPLAKTDYEKIKHGIELEDGKIKVDKIAFPEKDNRKIVGVEIHSGRNRIIRRIFEHLGYEATKLDRVVYASLTKKNLPRGKWRFLTSTEVSFLYKYQKNITTQN